VSTDWERLGETWRSGGGPDVAALEASVRRKRRRMVVLVSLEVALTLAAIPLLLFVALRRPQAIERAWAWTMLAFSVPFEALLLYLRRGQWQTPTLGVTALLELVARRARTGIRLAWLNLAATLLGAALTVPFAVRAKHPDRLLPTLIALAVLSVAAAAFCVWYIPRQRRRLRETGELLRELGREAAPPPSPGGS
jgi:hypothetical protein